MVSSAENNLMPGLNRLKKEGSRSANQTFTRRIIGGISSAKSE